MRSYFFFPSLTAFRKCRPPPSQGFAYEGPHSVGSADDVSAPAFAGGHAFLFQRCPICGSTLYCHNGEMDMSVCLIVCVCHIFTFRCLSSLLWGFLVQEVSGLLGLRSLALDDLHYRQLVVLDVKADVVVGEGEAVEAGGVVVVVGRGSRASAWRRASVSASESGLSAGSGRTTCS